MIVDGVIHAFNMDESNYAHPVYSARFANGIYSHHKMWSPPDSEYILERDQIIRDFDVDDTALAVFAESPIDVAVYHATPIFDFFKDGLSGLDKGVRLKAEHPDRVLLYGGISLLEKKAAIRELERQVAEIGIDGIKFYPAIYMDGRTVATSLADRDVTFPVIERAQELGVRNVAVHKALPLGPTETAPYKVNDVEVSAAAFPDMNFEIVHAGLAFSEETALVLARFANVYANLEATFGAIARAPREFWQSMGIMAHWAGWEKLIFASGCNVSHPRPLIEAFQAGEMPEDLVEGWDYPVADQAAKDLVLGGNLARIHNLDPARVPTDDLFARLRAENPAPWSRIRSEAYA